MDVCWIKRFRLLVVALILSCALNIGLLFAFIFPADKILLPQVRTGQIQDPIQSTYKNFLVSSSKLSFAELVAFLTNRELVEEGLTQRDLALAALVAFHDFHLEKALSSSPDQTRQVVFSPDQTIELYPGLDDEQFDAIIRFAYREKWPLTPKGLFQVLKKRGLPLSDESLKNAFFSTPEFRSLQQLFQKSMLQSPENLLSLICEGPWSLLDQFVKEQSQVLDLSADRRRNLLLSYLSQGSSVAAQILLQTDFVFARQKMEDSSIAVLLSLLKEKTPEAERFCRELLIAPRTDLIWKAASERLYVLTGQEIPQLPQSAPNAPRQQHIVKDGENLWKIARQYKVRVDDLVKVNELEKDQLRPGMILFVP